MKLSFINPLSLYSWVLSSLYMVIKADYIWILHISFKQYSWMIQVAIREQCLKMSTTKELAADSF